MKKLNIMKKLYITIILVCFLLKPNLSYSQDASDIAVAAGALIAIGGVIGSVGAAEEQLELKATEWVLANMDIKKFNVEVLSFGSTKVSDMSSTGVVPFKLYEFEINDMPNGEYQFTIINRYVLLMYSFPGFISSNGIDYTDVFYELVDKDLWFKRMGGYVTSASNTDVDINTTLKEGIILNKGVTNGAEKTRGGAAFGNNYDGDDLKIRFYKLDGDSYIISDYEDEFKYLYNEKSLGMFHKPTNRLFQVKAKFIRDIHSFLLRETPVTLN